jgi:hypothetical protein
MKKYIIIFMAIILFSSFAFGQKLTLHFLDGHIDTVLLNDETQMYFVDTNTSVTRLSSPVNGERSVAQNPRFSWQHIPNKEFEFILSLHDTFNDTLLHVNHIDTNEYQCNITLNIQTRYYWKVRIQGEELWTAAWYFDTYAPLAPNKLISLALLPADDLGSVQLKTRHNSEIDSFMVVCSFDGISFSDTTYCDTSDMIINSLAADSCYYMKIAGVNAAGVGPLSEMLAVSVTTVEQPVLIVNGFDRTTAGNSLDFIRQHAEAVLANGYTFVSATNEALTDGLLSFPFYSDLIYILGEESTIDETFSVAEQDIFKNYLKNGGKVFISGAEIAWDIDYKGSALDKNFCHEFLHLAYAQDAPNNATGTYYNVKASGDTIFSDLSSFSFDNGTHGTYDVRYPDVFTPLNDARAFLKYTGCSTGAAGIVFEGMFPGGSQDGKIMVLGFPFETIYPAEKRNALMSKFFQFSEFGLAIDNAIDIPQEHCLNQNYPNPFNPVTAISFQLANFGNVDLSIYDMRGSLIEVLFDGNSDAGHYEIMWNASNVATGMYICVMRVDNVIVTSRKMLLIK